MSKLQRQCQGREASVTQQRANPAAAAPARSAAVFRHAPGAVVQRAMAAPHSLRPSEFLAMQRTLGNNVAGAMLGRMPVQAKLTISAPGDRWEREADRVADAVMRRHDETVGPRLSPSVMPEPNTTQVSEGSLAADEDFTHQLQASRGRPLPPALRERFEGKLGADFGGVRVHTDAAAGRLSRAIQAQAFTRGPDIFVGPGHHAPGTAAGQRLLAHELAHVVQQSAAPAEGAVEPGRAPQPAAEPGGHIQRKLDWRTGTKWENAKTIRASEKGGAGILMVKDEDDPPVVLKGEGDAAVEVMLAAALHGAKSVGAWAIQAPRVRPVEKDERKKIVKHLEPMVETEREGKILLGATTKPGGLVFEFLHGKTFQALLEASAPAKSHKELGKDNPLRMFEDQDFVRALGRATAIDIFTGNFDRLTRQIAPGNFLVDENLISLIDNVFLEGGYAFTQKEGAGRETGKPYLVEESFKNWASEPFVKLLRDDVPGAAQRIFTNCMGQFQTASKKLTAFAELDKGAYNQATTRELVAIESVLGKNKDNIQKWLVEGLLRGKQDLAHTNWPDIIEGLDESARKEVRLSVINRLEFLGLLPRSHGTAPTPDSSSASSLSTATSSVPSSLPPNRPPQPPSSSVASSMGGATAGPFNKANRSDFPLPSTHASFPDLPSVPSSKSITPSNLSTSKTLSSPAAASMLQPPSSSAASSMGGTMAGPFNKENRSDFPLPPPPLVVPAQAPAAPLPAQLGGSMTTAGTGYENWSIPHLLQLKEQLISVASSAATAQLAAVEAELRKNGY